MVWSEGDEWKASADVSPGDKLEYKYVVLGPHGIVEWQSGGNRSLVVDVPEGGAVTVVDEWYGTFQKVSKDIPKTAEGAPSLPTVAAEPAQKRGHPLGFFAKHRLPASIHRTFSANKGAQNGTATEASKELTKKEAKALLEKRGLPTDGRKIDLLERLRASA